MKGTYVLVLELKKDAEIEVGKLGKIFFKKGFYAYVGSALNGLEQRIKRHMQKEKKIFWHIDYLLQYATIKQVFCKEGNTREECNIAKSLQKKLTVIPIFGCSDCKCKSHLFYGSYNKIINSFKDSNLFIFNIF